jgi:hypothetical protein
VSAGSEGRTDWLLIQITEDETGAKWAIEGVPVGLAEQIIKSHRFPSPNEHPAILSTWDAYRVPTA